MLHNTRKSGGGSGTSAKKVSGTGTRKVSPPGPTFMNSDQMANYLADLRSNRPSRPLGSRPFPGKSSHFPAREGDQTSSQARSTQFASASTESFSNDPTSRSPSFASHRRSNSAAPAMGNSGKDAGRPLAREPEPGVQVRDFSGASSRISIASPSAVPYRETGSRWSELSEARQLRLALEELDLREEQRVHAAAQDEAAELVWQHQNPQQQGAPFPNPDYRGPRSRVIQLEKGHHARSQSLGGYGDVNRRAGQPDRAGYRSASDSSSGSNVGAEYTEETRTKKPSVTFAVPAPFSPRRRSGAHPRSVSGESGKGLFRNPEDQIYEEPGETEQPAPPAPTSNDSASTPLSVKPRNALPRGSRSPFDRSATVPTEEPKTSKYEIHKNPPSQSRNPGYVSNDFSVTPPRVDTPDTPTKNGIEIRGEDLRAATSMKLKDRSPKLPQPTVVSDRPGRPIVSFDTRWQPREADTKGNVSPTRDLPKPHPPSTTVSAPIVPRIQLLNDTSSRPSSRQEQRPSKNHAQSTSAIPTLSLPDGNAPSIAVTDVPSISVSDGPDRSNLPARPRPLPTPVKSHSLPATSSSFSRPHISPSNHTHAYRKGPTATCTTCQLPISGRIVTASSHRFHPECFTCHHCSEALECVAFYPEPESKRAERLARDDEDSDEGLRFFCHLDYHEFFSPRCKSCKTPIEGEVVVAAGAEWHVGHFFCAECGDPFDATTPFVEHNNYAWCVGCHTKRTSSRCRGCKQLVLSDVIISALGGQWHAECFRCVECGGGFGDEGRFFVRSGPDGRDVGVCEKCEGRRLKAY